MGPPEEGMYVSQASKFSLIPQFTGYPCGYPRAASIFVATHLNASTTDALGTTWTLVLRRESELSTPLKFAVAQLHVDTV